MISHGIFEIPSGGEPVSITIPANYNLYIGTVVPTGDIGVPGDWYIYVGVGQVYRKLSITAWTFEGYLAGASAAVTGVFGTIGEIDVAPNTGVPVVSLPTNLIFTGKSVLNGSFTDIALLGVSTAPTAALGTNTTQIATTAFVINEIAAIGPASAGTLIGTTLASNVVNSSLVNAAGGTFGTAAFTSASAYEPALGNPGVNGYVLGSTTAGVRSWISPSTGSVTSVAASVPSFLSVSGSPITSSGTLAITYSGTPLPIANGGTGTTIPALVQGANITITGAWPNQTITAAGGGSFGSTFIRARASSDPM